MPISTSKLNPLHLLRSTHTLISNATSTRWPGHTWFAIPLLVLALPLAVFQAASILALGIYIRSLPSTMPCYTLNGSASESAFPLTFGELDGAGVLSMGAKPGVWVLFAASFTPCLVVAALAFMVYMHKRSAGIENRTAFCKGLATLILILLDALFGARLSPDTVPHSTSASRTICFVPAATFSQLANDRAARWTLSMGNEISSALGVMCMSFYLALCITAMRRNRQAPAPPNTRASSTAEAGGIRVTQEFEMGSVRVFA